MKSIALTFAAAIALFIVAAACTTEKTVYVLPDGTEVTPFAQSVGKNQKAILTTTFASVLTFLQ